MQNTEGQQPASSAAMRCSALSKAPCPNCGELVTYPTDHGQTHGHEGYYCTPEPQGIARSAAITIVRYFDRYWLNWTPETRIAEAERVIKQAMDMQNSVLNEPG